MIFTHKATIGCVIQLSEDDCKIVSTVHPGEYVVEDARDKGGWYVEARKLDNDGKYDRTGELVNFYQSDGYIKYLPMVYITRFMSRVFV